VTSPRHREFNWPRPILNLFCTIWKRQSELTDQRWLKYSRPSGGYGLTDDFDLFNNMKLHQPSTTFGGLVLHRQESPSCAQLPALTLSLQDRNYSGGCLKLLSTPRWAKALLAAFLRQSKLGEWRSRLTDNQYYILRGRHRASLD
jgi:hypothetical protein